MSPGRLVPLSSLALALALVPTGSASAAAPANDYVNRPVVIRALPFTTSQDSTGATTGPADRASRTCGLPSRAASVWYAFTPARDTGVAVRTAGSDYATGVVVSTGPTSAPRTIGCGEGGATVRVSAGVRYRIAVYDVGRDDGRNGGLLRMTVREEGPVDLTVRVDPVVTLGADGATVRGSFTCRRGRELEFSGSLTQVRPAGTVSGTFGIERDCTGTVPWSLLVHEGPDGGAFTAGPATVEFQGILTNVLFADIATGTVEVAVEAG